MATFPPARPLVVAPGSGIPARPGAAILADAATTGGSLGAVESRLPVGASPPRHVHHAEDEAFYVLGGSLTVACGEERFRAEPGSFVYLPRELAHTFRVVGVRPARLLIIMVPAGFEDFFTIHADPNTDPEAFAEIYRRRRIDIVGPSLDG